jgi:hypothetical protein
MDGEERRSGMTEAEQAELLDALEAAHRDLDVLLATIVGLDRSFRPSQSSVWPNMEARADLLRRHGRFR